jgi:hypothetical protein
MELLFRRKQHRRQRDNESLVFVRRAASTSTLIGQGGCCQPALAVVQSASMLGCLLQILLLRWCKRFFGTVCMAVGYSGAILDIGNSTLTSIAFGVIQMAWLPFTAGLSGLVLGAMSDPESNPFVPAV